MPSPPMSSDDEAPRVPPRPVTLFDQADAAAEIVCDLTEHKIKVVTTGTVAVGLLTRNYGQPEARRLAEALQIELFVATSKNRDKAAAALGGPRQHGYPVFELAYDQPQNVAIKVHPAWLKSEGRLVRSTGIKVPVSSPRTILLDLLCSTADSFECNAVEQAYSDLSALYVFSLLVSRTTVDGRSSSPYVPMDWTHETWLEDYAEHLRDDDKLADRYADVRRMLKKLDVDEHLSEAGLRRWATWLLANVERSRRVHVQEATRSSSPDSDAHVVVERMSTFLHRVKAMMLPPRSSPSPNARPPSLHLVPLAH
ncbi:hypothetical protein JCM8208_001190 [Rhodotorula glutinis]